MPKLELLPSTTVYRAFAKWCKLEHLLVGNRQDAHLFREFSRGWDKLQETVQQNMTYKATR
jgi:hypothetical protein